MKNIGRGEAKSREENKTMKSNRRTERVGA
jgi:hypothetical protein